MDADDLMLEQQLLALTHLLPVRPPPASVAPRLHLPFHPLEDVRFGPLQCCMRAVIDKELVFR